MKRCVHCRRLIWPWPWQRVGWYMISDRRAMYWHARCRGVSR